MMDKMIFTDIDGHRGCFCLSNDKLNKANFFTEQNDQVGNIYIGRVANILPNLHACFVEYQKGEQGFLPLNDEQLKTLKCESRILVQVKKAKVKTKEAVLTTEISIPGLYCVGFYGDFNKDSTYSFSKKLSKESKNILLNILPELDASFGFVIRTNTIHLNEDSYQLLVQEIETIKAQLEYIKIAFDTRSFYSLLSPEVDFIKQSMGELDLSNLPAVITDQKEEYEELKQILPGFCEEKITLYEDDKYPLSALYGLRSKLNEAISKTVWLKSGGYLVIEPTEAMVVVDVNTGKNLKKISKQELVKITNKEACETLAHIIPAANYSGIIVVDFINFDNKKDEDYLMSYLKELLKDDPIKTEVIDITSLGLIEITRRKNDALLITKIKELGITL